jgi:hypothetical protein
MLTDAGHSATSATLHKVATNLAAISARGDFFPDAPGEITIFAVNPGDGRRVSVRGSVMHTTFVVTVAILAGCHPQDAVVSDAAPDARAIDAITDTGTPSKRARGLFVPILALNANGTSNAMQALALPDIDGIAIDVEWTEIADTMPMTYDFTALDAMIQLAVTANKAVELSVIASGGTPAWFDPSTVIHLQYTPHDGGTGRCTDTFTPPLWDPTYLAAWDDMTAQLAAHLTAKGFADSVVAFRLTGLNASTAESHLAEQVPAAATTPQTCAAANDALTVDNVATWQAAGYTPTKLQAGWAAMVKSWATHFPAALFEFVTWEGDDPRFPPIDDTGTIVAPSNSVDKAQYDQAVASAAAQLGSRLVVGRFFLMTDTPAEPSVVAYANTFNIATIWQTNLWWSISQNAHHTNIPGAAGCGNTITDPVQCTESLFLDELEEGVNPTGLTVPLPAGATPIIEVHLPDPALYPNATHTVHVALTQ